MSFKFSKSIIVPGLICTSLTAIAAMAQNTDGEMPGSSVPLLPPGLFSSDSNPSASENAPEKPADDGKFAPLDFDPERPGTDASVGTNSIKQNDEGKAEAVAPKPAYAPAETAKIPVPEVKKKPVEADKAPKYAPAGTGKAPPPSNVLPGYGYQQPQFMPRRFMPPQFQVPQYQFPQNRGPQYHYRQYPTPQRALGNGYTPRYYPPCYVPQQGFRPQWGNQPYPNPQMQPQPWGYQQPQWQQPQMQRQPWGNQQPQWQMPPQGYRYPPPDYWNPFRPPVQQGWPLKNIPRSSNQPGN